MFDFVDNQVIKIMLELIVWIISTILGFLGGVNYTKKTNNIGNIYSSNIGDIKQENK